MSATRKILLAFVLIIAIGYGGIKTYLHMQIKSRVEQVVELAKPFVAITYEGISTELLTGDVYIEHIEFRPINIEDEVLIDALGIITPGLMFLLGDAEQSLQAGKIPEKIGLSIQGGRIDLAGELMQMLTQLEHNSSEQALETGLACTLSQAYQTEQYRELGFEYLVFNTAILLKHRQDRQTLALNVNFALQDIEEIDFDMTLENFESNNVTNIMVSAQTPPPLKSLALSYRPDPNFIQTTQQYCANLKGVSEQAFVDQLVDQSNSAYYRDLGFIPGPGLRSILKGLLTDGGELIIDAQANNAVDPITLPQLRPNQIIEALGITVSLNGEHIDDLSFSMNPSTANFSDNGVAQANQPQNTSGSRNNKPKEKTIKLSYLPTDPRQLHQKIGKEVRIKTKQGKIRKGVITHFEDKKVTIKIRMAGGNIAINIPVSEIKSCEIKAWI